MKPGTIGSEEESKVLSSEITDTHGFPSAVVLGEDAAENEGVHVSSGTVQRDVEGAGVGTARGDIQQVVQRALPLAKSGFGTDAAIKLLQILVSLALTALLLEGLFAWLGMGEQEFLRPDRTLGTVHLRNKLVTWRLEGYSRDRLTKDGLRDVEHVIAKPSGTYRILLLGDSATEALQVPLEKTFARKLEKLLNERLGRGQVPSKSGIEHYEVINLGCSGYSTGQELVALEREGLKYAPDLVVVLYSRGDSLENVVYPQTRDVAEPRPYFYLDANGELKLDDSILASRASQLDSPQWLNFLRTNSRLYGVWSQANFNLTLTDKLYNRLSKSWKQLLTKLTRAGHGNSSVSESVPAYSLQDNYQVTEKLIGRLNTTCGAAGAKLIVMTFPDVKSIDPEFKRQLVLLREQSKKEQFSLLELSPYFGKVANPNALFLEVHFSEAGHDVVTQALADKLLPNQAQ